MYTTPGDGVTTEGAPEPVVVVVARDAELTMPCCDVDVDSPFGRLVGFCPVLEVVDAADRTVSVSAPAVVIMELVVPVMLPDMPEGVPDGI